MIMTVVLAVAAWQALVWGLIWGEGRLYDQRYADPAISTQTGWILATLPASVPVALMVLYGLAYGVASLFVRGRRG